jgi:hypothetical protein
MRIIRGMDEKEATKYYRGILEEYKNGQYLSGDHFNEFMGLLHRHPNYEEKVKNGVSDISVIHNKTGKVLCIIDDNGDTEIFSYLKCIRGNYISKRKSFINATWFLIKEYNFTYKKQYFKENEDENKQIICMETGEKITWKESFTIHREPSITKICDMFIEKNKIDLNNVLYTNDGNGHQFADKELSRNFLEFYKSVCNLKLVKKRSNKEDE